MLTVSKLATSAVVGVVDIAAQEAGNYLPASQPGLGAHDLSRAALLVAGVVARKHDFGEALVISEIPLVEKTLLTNVLFLLKIPNNIPDA